MSVNNESFVKAGQFLRDIGELRLFFVIVKKLARYFVEYVQYNTFNIHFFGHFKYVPNVIILL